MRLLITSNLLASFPVNSNLFNLPSQLLCEPFYFQFCYRYSCSVIVDGDAGKINFKDTCSLICSRVVKNILRKFVRVSVQTPPQNWTFLKKEWEYLQSDPLFRCFKLKTTTRNYSREERQCRAVLNYGAVCFSILPSLSFWKIYEFWT